MKPLPLWLQYAVLGIALLSHASKGELIGHWGFEEGQGTVITNSITGQKGIATNGFWGSGRVGRYCYNFERSGSGALVSLMDPATFARLDGSPYTFSWWQKYSEISFSFGNASVDEGVFSVRFQNGFRVQGSRRDTNETWFTKNEIDYGAWHHLALVWNGSVQKAYMDGSLLDFRPISSGLPHVTTNLFLGTGITTDFGGALDDFRIYNHALTASDISAIISEVTPRITIVAIRNGHLFFAWDLAGSEIYRIESAPLTGGKLIWTMTGTNILQPGRTNTVLLPIPVEPRVYRLHEF